MQQTIADPRWAAIVERDTAADGTFYYSVQTTGVYCRPSCPARLARPEHVDFYLTPADAERAGFRPCKRCKPDQMSGARRHVPAEIRFTFKPSSLGLILVAQSALGVCAVLLGDDHDVLVRDLQQRFPAATLVPADSTLASLVAARIEGSGREDELPLDMQGTAFQRTVWRALREIPRGTTQSYSDIARRIGRPNAVRAVAHACASNPLAVLVPCHRAVRRDGALAGYRWGIERKRALLKREARRAEG